MLTAESNPLTPDIVVGFMACLAGVVYTLASRNAHAKRIVFPVTLVVAYVLAYVVMQRQGVFERLSPLLVIGILVVSAAQTLRVVRFCATCGRTTAMPLLSRQTAMCQTCRAAVAK
jgi:uncharacterized membrane protein HdeD (DUF308 family)